METVQVVGAMFYNSQTRDHQDLAAYLGVLGHMCSGSVLGLLSTRILKKFIVKLATPTGGKVLN